MAISDVCQCLTLIFAQNAGTSQIIIYIERVAELSLTNYPKIRNLILLKYFVSET